MLLQQACAPGHLQGPQARRHHSDMRLIHQAGHGSREGAAGEWQLACGQVAAAVQDKQQSVER